MAKKGKKKNSSATFVALAVFTGFVLGVVSVLVLLKYSGVLSPEPPPVQRAERPPARAERAPEPKPPSTETAEPAPTAPTEPSGPRVAVVIDDMGGDIKKLDTLSGLDSPVTIAVLPQLAHSAQTADRAHSNGLEVILHLPMEPRDMAAHDPGPGVLLSGMSAEEISSLINKDLETVPFAIGANNHMGSRFTEDEAGMEAVIGLLSERGLFFLDSRTTGGSVVGRVASAMGASAASRDVFLDNNRDVEYIKGQLRKLVRIARAEGTAIGIGHPYPETLEALAESMPELRAQGVRFVPLSELVTAPGPKTARAR